MLFQPTMADEAQALEARNDKQKQKHQANQKFKADSHLLDFSACLLGRFSGGG